MAGNQFCRRRYLRDQFADIFNQTLNTAATFQIHKREPSGEEIITEVDHVGSRKEDDAVAVSMAVRKVNRANLFTVEVNRQRLIEGNNRERFLRRGRSSSLEEF